MTKISSPDRHAYADLASDILWGAAAIGGFIGLSPRKVYASTDKLPIFRKGAILCARKSELRAALSAVK
jgi:hypothetical protein